jgi:hypothetical protein
MSKLTKTLAAALVVIGATFPLTAEANPFKDFGHKVKDTAKEVGRDIKHGAKEAGHSVKRIFKGGAGTRSGARGGGRHRGTRPHRAGRHHR